MTSAAPLTPGTAATSAERPARRRPRLAIVGSGAGSTAAAILAAVRAGDLPVDVGVVVGNNSGAGVFEVARAHGVPTAHLSRVTHPDPDALDAAFLATLSEHGADLVVLAGYMRRLGPRVLAAYTGRVLNTHPALLPAYGGHGMYGDRVHAAVLADGVATTGASVHLVTADYDEGPVVAQVSVPIEPGDDVDSLRDRVQAAEKQLLVDHLREACSATDRERSPS
ncbi:phosphoribosylglycinamide formyltransferase-1 [Cellulosimicrobium cellulans]|uniref:Phosphoribosylglycinamide formyltransferase n=1 Tax=Cellulosimicrobium cellulans TaxID=1710 RepID=A0A1Y0HWB9_CELCE|nr:phosphoribosylglycinamide formyltransferase [Cellulosimicrobium cellulans]ARU52488.1 phosphoribosylglycinamide formyltransferase [Cellulosimicrobium cellulans]MBM7819138.1 phosphoribosylglycinamide formyltransferase-1 [Cellulosimicrobium cellulans]